MPDQTEHSDEGQLADLHRQGLLTDAEFDEAQERLNHRDDPAAAAAAAGAADADAGADADVPSQPESEPEPEPVALVPDDEAAARRRLWMWAIPAVLLAAGVGLILWAVLGGGSSSSTASNKLVVSGIVVVTNHQGVYPDDPTVTQGQQFGTGGYTVGKGCHTLTGYQDLRGGATVVVRDADGSALGRTTLRAGVFDTNADCVFGFAAEVPKGRSGYQIAVAQREPVPYTPVEIAAPIQMVLN